MPVVTANVPETMSRQARAIARERGETVADVLRQALAKHISDYLEEADDIRHVDEIEARIASGQERLYSHEEVWAELDALEARGALPD